jgi:hypothetical protein
MLPPNCLNQQESTPQLRPTLLVAAGERDPCQLFRGIHGGLFRAKADSKETAPGWVLGKRSCRTGCSFLVGCQVSSRDGQDSSALFTPLLSAI